MTAILLKEFRSYLRMGRPFLTLSIYISLVSGLVWFIYAVQYSDSFSNRSDLGILLYTIVIGFALLQLVFLATGFNASSLGLERDRQTIDLLLITPISTFKLILGKMSAPILYLFLLSLAIIPLVSLTFFIGGIELIDIVIGFLIMASTILGYGTVGIWAASRSASSRSGLLVAQGIGIGLSVIIPIFAVIIAGLLGQMAFNSSLAEWLVTSPIIRWPALIILSLSPFTVLVSWIVTLASSGSMWTIDMPSELGGGVIPQIWIISLISWVVVIAFLLRRSVKQLPNSVAKHGGG